MEKERLIRKLNSVGKEMFVRYYHLFEDYSNNRITKDAAIRTLVDEGVSNEAGASMRLGNAKAIFSAQGTCEALIIIQSARVSDKVIDAAKKISVKECR